MDTQELEKIRQEFSQAQDPATKLKYALELSVHDPEVMRPVIQLLEPSVVDAPSVMLLKLGKQEFQPLVAYPIFPADFIIGYRNPRITLEFDEETLLLLVTVEYDGEPASNATNIVESIGKCFPSQFVFTDRQKWEAACLNERKALNFPPSSVIGELTTPQGERVVARLLDFKQSKEYLQRVFVFSLFFIEGALLPDFNDLSWQVAVLNRAEAPHTLYGYCSLYRFWSYLGGAQFDDTGITWRYRIAQYLVLPPFQRQKLAIGLYRFIVQHAQQDKSITDIQVEDASLEFDIMCERANFEALSSNPATRAVLEKYADDPEAAVLKLAEISKLSKAAIRQAAEVYLYREIGDPKSKVLKRLILDRVYADKYADLASLDPAQLRTTLEQEYEQEIRIIMVVLGELSYEDLVGSGEYDDEEDAEEDAIEDIDELAAAIAQSAPSKRARQE